MFSLPSFSLSCCSIAMSFLMHSSLIDKTTLKLVKAFCFDCFIIALSSTTATIASCSISLSRSALVSVKFPRKQNSTFLNSFPVNKKGNCNAVMFQNNFKFVCFLKTVYKSFSGTSSKNKCEKPSLSRKLIATCIFFYSKDFNFLRSKTF